jgi:peptidoglycan/LPS O-acetylase OafA/YrhL
VDLFFVLSGFLIGGILLDVRESPNDFRTFYGRRFYRIVPLYYLWIAVYFSFEAFRTAPETWHAIPIYALFLQNSVKIEHGVLGTAWLGALCSLAVEEQFYLIVPAVVRVFSGRKLVFILSSAIVCAPVFRIALRHFVPAHPAAPYMLTACRADALAMGVLLALGWRNEKCKALFYRYRTLVFAACLLLLAAYLYLAIWNPSQYTPEMYA